MSMNTSLEEKAQLRAKALWQLYLFSFATIFTLGMSVLVPIVVMLRQLTMHPSLFVLCAGLLVSAGCSASSAAHSLAKFIILSR